MQVNQEAASQTDEKSIEIPNKRDTSPQKKKQVIDELRSMWSLWYKLWFVWKILIR